MGPAHATLSIRLFGRLEVLAGDVQVRITGDAAAFRAAAAGLGLAVEGDGDGEAWLVVRGADPQAVLRGVRDAACTAGVGLRELRPAGPTLEESLIGAIG